jgi:HAD superfamily hydrolase (TIGR01484 family)
VRRLRVVVVDIDGCLTPGEAAPWDFEVLRYVAEINQRARREDAPFAITLCTGRQQPYVEAMMQAIDGYLPAIYENGGGLYYPQPYKFVEHPAITQGTRTRRDEIRRVVQKELVERGIAYLQPGKEVTLTLYPAREELALAHIADMARRVVGELLDGFTLFASRTSIEILPSEINKGAGVEWLAHEIQIPLDQFGGIGDAPADLTFLNRVGYSAAPANATVEVKANVQYTSPLANGRGVCSILEKWLDVF